MPYKDPEKRREWWRRSPLAKIARKKYEQSEKGKAARKRVKRSEKRKISEKRYFQSKKGKIVKRRFLLKASNILTLCNSLHRFTKPLVKGENNAEKRRKADRIVSEVRAEIRRRY
jgi:hypothetical protein